MNPQIAAFFDLDVDKMCGQWNAAIQISLDYPGIAPNLLATVAARSVKTDFDILIGGPAAVTPTAFADARNRVTHQVQRAVDSFQITTAFRWRWSMQLAALAISFGIALIALLVLNTVDPASAVIMAALAGFLSPVARDLVAAIQKLRN